MFLASHGNPPDVLYLCTSRSGCILYLLLFHSNLLVLLFTYLVSSVLSFVFFADAINLCLLPELNNVCQQRVVLMALKPAESFVQRLSVSQAIVPVISQAIDS